MITFGTCDRPRGGVCKKRVGSHKASGLGTSTSQRASRGQTWKVQGCQALQNMRLQGFALVSSSGVRRECGARMMHSADERPLPELGVSDYCIPSYTARLAADTA